MGAVQAPPPLLGRRLPCAARHACMHCVQCSGSALLPGMHAGEQLNMLGSLPAAPACCTVI